MSMLGNNLSYLELNLAKDGTVLTRDEIREERIRKGYCTECRGVPVRLFHVKKSKFNPLWKTKIPCSDPGKSQNGKCILCNPELKVITAKVRAVSIFPFRPNRSKKHTKSAKIAATVPTEEDLVSSRNRNVSAISNPVNSESNDTDHTRIHNETNIDGSEQEQKQKEETIDDALPGIATEIQNEINMNESEQEEQEEKEEDVDDALPGIATKTHNEINMNKREQEEKEEDVDDAMPDYIEMNFDRKRKISTKRPLRQLSSAMLDYNSPRSIEAKGNDVTLDENTSCIRQSTVLLDSQQNSLEESPGTLDSILDQKQVLQNSLQPLQDEEVITSDTPENPDAMINEIESLIKDIDVAGDCDFVVDIIIDFMKDNRNCVSIQNFCLLKFSALCSANDNYKKSMVSTSAPDDILLCMKTHLKEATTQQYGCEAIWSCCNDKQGRDIRHNILILVRAGVVARIIKGIMEHIDEKDVVKSGLGCLRSLTIQYEAREAFVMLSGVEPICRAMNYHTNVAVIQRDGCALLSNSAVDMEKQQVSLASKCELKVVINALASHGDNASVVEGACFALKNYTYDERNVRSLKELDDSIQILEDFYQQSKDSKVSDIISVVLDRVSHLKETDESLESHLVDTTLNHMIEDPTVEPRKKVQQVIDLMEEYDWSCKVLTAVFQSLTLLYQCYPLQRNLLETSGVIQTVIARMETYKSFAPIQINGCKLFSEILKNADSLRTTILDADGCGVIMEIVLDHKSNVEAQIAALSVLKTLSKEFECWVLLLHLNFSIEDVMTAHPENQLIQDYGLEIMTNLSLHGTSG